jgi:hypothetical protein
LDAGFVLADNLHPLEQRTDDLTGRRVGSVKPFADRFRHACHVLYCQRGTCAAHHRLDPIGFDLRLFPEGRELGDALS